MEERTDLTAREGGKLYMRGGTEEDEEWERSCGRNNSGNKTAMEERAAELVGGMQEQKGGSNIRRIRQRVED